MIGWLYFYLCGMATFFICTLCFSTKEEGIFLNLLLAVLFGITWPVIVLVYLGCNIWDAIEAHRKIK